MSLHLQIDEFPIPATLDGPDGDTFRDIIDLRDRIAGDALGPAAGNTLPEESHPYMLDQTHERNRVLIARSDGQFVGVAMMYWAVDPEAKVTWGEVNVVPEWRGQGIGSKLLEEIEAFAREIGRPTVQGGAFHRSVEGPRLESPTGFGSLPADEATVRFLRNRGFCSSRSTATASSISRPMPRCSTRSTMPRWRRPDPATGW